VSRGSLRDLAWLIVRQILILTLHFRIPNSLPKDRICSLFSYSVGNMEGMAEEDVALVVKTDDLQVKYSTLLSRSWLFNVLFPTFFKLCSSRSLFWLMCSSKSSNCFQLTSLSIASPCTLLHLHFFLLFAYSKIKKSIPHLQILPTSIC
jgi:hypothetical protein